MRYIDTFGVGGWAVWTDLNLLEASKKWPEPEVVFNFAKLYFIHVPFRN
jgi:hypothetical protein